MRQKFNPIFFHDKLIEKGMTVADFHAELIRYGKKISLTRLYNFYRGQARPRDPGDLILFQKILGGKLEDWVKMVNGLDPQ